MRKYLAFACLFSVSLGTGYNPISNAQAGLFGGNKTEICFPDIQQEDFNKDSRKIKKPSPWKMALGAGIGVAAAALIPVVGAMLAVKQFGSVKKYKEAKKIYNGQVEAMENSIVKSLNLSVRDAILNQFGNVEKVKIDAKTGEIKRIQFRKNKNVKYKFKRKKNGSFHHKNYILNPSQSCNAPDWSYTPTPEEVKKEEERKQSLEDAVDEDLEG